MPKSIIEQEIEGITIKQIKKQYKNVKYADEVIVYPENKLNLAIQKALKEAEKKIDAPTSSSSKSVEFRAGYLNGFIDCQKKVKQILNDCFGAGK